MLYNYSLKHTGALMINKIISAFKNFQNTKRLERELNNACADPRTRNELVSIQLHKEGLS